MIYNRTQKDVDDAIRLISEKVKTFQELTTQDIETLERGTLTINTLNRIEEKTQELSELLNNIGYWHSPFVAKHWEFGQIFHLEDFERILNNLKILRDSFLVYKDTPEVPYANYTRYQTINDVEKLLHDLERLIPDVISHYRECGTFECGEV